MTNLGKGLFISCQALSFHSCPLLAVGLMRCRALSIPQCVHTSVGRRAIVLLALPSVAPPLALLSVTPLYVSDDHEQVVKCLLCHGMGWGGRTDVDFIANALLGFE